MKKTISAILAVVMVVFLFAACSNKQESSSAIIVSSFPESAPRAELKIAGLKGPTTMGMVKLMSEAEAGETRHDYNVEIFGTPDEISGKLILGELDIAAIPANLASIIYNKTGGAIQVAAINTLGVLYIIETGEAINSVEDLKGKTIYSTGKGTTPEYVLNYILTENGIDPESDLTIEYKSEASEVAALLASSENAIAILPQPYATAVQLQNEKARIALSLTDEWDKVSGGTTLVTGVLVARKEFIEANEAVFKEFLEDYSASITFVNENIAEAAELIAQYGIVEKVAMAQKALPFCNITYIDKVEMKENIEAYLTVLFSQAPDSVGGMLPKIDFYFEG